MAKYKRKPNVVEAFKWTGGPDQTEDPVWIVDAIKSGKATICRETEGSQYLDGSGVKKTKVLELWMEIETLEGTMRANQGDYIVKGIAGEIYPCKSDIFEANHEIIEHDND